jgi:poly(hydroxyalkanoate) depolymerase family esterase
MNDGLHAEMLEATRLTRAGRLTEATALLQRVLRNGSVPDAASGPSGETANAPAGPVPRTIDLTCQTIEVNDPQPPPRIRHASGTGASSRPAGKTQGGAQPHLPEALRRFLARGDRTQPGPGTGGLVKRSPAHPPDVVPDGGQFLAASYSNQAGSHAYKLYVPSGYHGQAVPLVVMLHGCTQSPDDFAAGTRMNALAEERTCLVAYPAQAASANASKCWNWFSPSDQRRGQGEPSLIAGITRQVMRNYSVDPERVYVAGLSAGAAAAAIMGMTYPDLYAAIGVHSGLACGVASDLPSALAAMRQGGAVAGRGSGHDRRMVPMIVFHGDRDSTVHPRNGDQVVAQSRATAMTDLQTTVRHGCPAGTPTAARSTPTRAGRRSSSSGSSMAPAMPGRAAAPPAPTPIRRGPMRRGRSSASSSSTDVPEPRRLSRLTEKSGSLVALSPRCPAVPVRQSEHHHCRLARRCARGRPGAESAWGCAG